MYGEGMIKNEICLFPYIFWLWIIWGKVFKNEPSKDQVFAEDSL